MSFQFEQGEILLVNKPYTWTSFDVVGKMRSMIRKQLGLRKIKIGHAGTLDPLASGLLILCTGKFTKRIEEFQGLEKEYAGTFRLGATTPSFDLETEPEQFLPFEHIQEAEIRDAACRFTGTFNQVPPAFSAKKIDGKRAYIYARNEINVEMESRPVTISAFEITRIALPEIDFRIVCSKGTYIRSLAQDFGKILGCGAHLTALCRTRIGNFYLRDAYDIEDLEAKLICQKNNSD
ncbi:MAG: tRNA pseudouridine(55) synthase TruB [Bacteroidales bacterium]|nr:tRNA pseudouridine(55) synthase TruB [Bacteroidales bacterium]MDD4602365.1 tRNA pseudouridine(55) synthase TruB [Bacteroidales bacterium]